ncbi:hypothetical protein Tco_1524890 [Tanacetum coccineum]
MITIFNVSRGKTYLCSLDHMTVFIRVFALWTDDRLRGSRLLYINILKSNSCEEENPSGSISPWHPFFAKRYLKAEWSYALCLFVHDEVRPEFPRKHTLCDTYAKSLASHISSNGRSQFGASGLELPRCVMVGDIFEKILNDPGKNRMTEKTPKSYDGGGVRFGKNYPKPRSRPSDFHRLLNHVNERLITYTLKRACSIASGRKACDGRPRSVWQVKVVFFDHGGQWGFGNKTEKPSEETVSQTKLSSGLREISCDLFLDLEEEVLDKEDCPASSRSKKSLPQMELG